MATRRSYGTGSSLNVLAWQVDVSIVLALIPLRIRSTSKRHDYSEEQVCAKPRRERFCPKWISRYWNFATLISC